MSDKAKAQKLAAARKKLKEYHQMKSKKHNEDEQIDHDNHLSDFKKSFLSGEESENAPVLQGSSEAVNHFEENSVKNNVEENTIKQTNGKEDYNNFEAIELLITEKATLSTQVTKLQTSCKEKDLEIEELNTVLQSSKRRIESLERTSVEQNSEISTLRSRIEELQHNLQTQENSASQYKLLYDEQTDHIEELKREINVNRGKIDKLEAELKDKSCQLELYSIRIHQISEQANVATDNRVEDLTQIKFTHEQQIKDLEAIVKQLNEEKEQANQQYQNYVQHLTKDISTYSEKNAELLSERSKLVEREKNMVEHITRLEKQIQEHIVRQEKTVKNNENEPNSEEIKENLLLKAEIESLQTLKRDLESKVQSSDLKIGEVLSELSEKQLYISDLEKKVEDLHTVQPNSAKLLASLESGKVAASRAVAQNEELKKQLEEIQLKLIQVTNEKVEVVEQLHSEQHTNKEMRGSYEHMSEQLKNTTEKLHFKDEEMIRLTHENNELNKKVLQLNQQLDRLMHYEAKEYEQKYSDTSEANNNSWSGNPEKCSHLENSASEQEQQIEVQSLHQHSDNTEELEARVQNLNNGTQVGIERASTLPSELPTTEAMVKLQDRFKTLIGEVAELTDEKQRLEHLVLQLQGETETIGEYIALYQTQRRVLKQREIEKDMQLHRLLLERDEMKSKISELCKVLHDVNSSQALPVNDVIVGKINDIITELKENDMSETKAITVDHCACCSGKFETI